MSVMHPFAHGGGCGYSIEFRPPAGVTDAWITSQRPTVLHLPALVPADPDRTGSVQFGGVQPGPRDPDPGGGPRQRAPAAADEVLPGHHHGRRGPAQLHRRQPRHARRHAVRVAAGIQRRILPRLPDRQRPVRLRHLQHRKRRRLRLPAQARHGDLAARLLHHRQLPDGAATAAGLRLRVVAGVVRGRNPAALPPVAEHEPLRGGAGHGGDGHPAARVAALRLPPRMAGGPHRARSVPAHLYRNRLDARLFATRVPPRAGCDRGVGQRDRPESDRGGRRPRAGDRRARPGVAGRHHLRRPCPALRRGRLVLRLAGARRPLCAPVRRSVPVHDPGAGRVRDHRGAADLLAGLGPLPADPGSDRAVEAGRQRHPDAAVRRVRADHRVGAEHAPGGPPSAPGIEPLAAAAACRATCAGCCATHRNRLPRSRRSYGASGLRSATPRCTWRWWRSTSPASCRAARWRRFWAAIEAPRRCNSSRCPIWPRERGSW